MISSLVDAPGNCCFREQDILFRTAGDMWNLNMEVEHKEEEGSEVIWIQ